MNPFNNFINIGDVVTLTLEGGRTSYAGVLLAITSPGITLKSGDSVVFVGWPSIRALVATKPGDDDEEEWDDES